MPDSTTPIGLLLTAVGALATFIGICFAYIVKIHKNNQKQMIVLHEKYEDKLEGTTEKYQQSLKEANAEIVSITTKFVVTFEKQQSLFEKLSSAIDRNTATVGSTLVTINDFHKYMQMISQQILNIKK